MSSHAIDAVSLSIMWDRLVGITDEIVSALIRSSFSTIVRESGDLSVVVLDTELRVFRRPICLSHAAIAVCSLCRWYAASASAGDCGVRAQALDRRGRLVDDFAIETRPRMRTEHAPPAPRHLTQSATPWPNEPRRRTVCR